MNTFTSQLYTLIKKEETQALIILGDESHPIFEAHFEGNPLLPAFLHVDIVTEIFGFKLIGISRAKFMEPLLPNDEMMITVEQRPLGMRVRLFKDTRIASEMTLEIQ